MVPQCDGFCAKMLVCDRALIQSRKSRFPQHSKFKALGDLHFLNSFEFGKKFELHFCPRHTVHSCVRSRPHRGRFDDAIPVRQVPGEDRTTRARTGLPCDSLHAVWLGGAERSWGSPYHVGIYPRPPGFSTLKDIPMSKASEPVLDWMTSAKLGPELASLLERIKQRPSLYRHRDEADLDPKKDAMQALAKSLITEGQKEPIIVIRIVPSEGVEECRADHRASPRGGYEASGGDQRAGLHARHGGAGARDPRRQPSGLPALERRGQRHPGTDRRAAPGEGRALLLNSGVDHTGSRST